MRRILIATFIWFFLQSFAWMIAIWQGMDPAVAVPLFTLYHGVGGVIYLIITRRLSQIPRAPVARRDIVFLCLLFFGPLGVIPTFFTLLSAGRGKGKVYEAYQEYVHEGQTDEAYTSVDYVQQMKKLLDREPVIDSVRYGETEARRGAAEILARMGGVRAMTALKQLATDPDPSIRFLAASRLTALEDRYMKDMEWYSDLIRVVGADPELLLQYGTVLLEFVQSGLVEREMLKVYANRGLRVLERLYGHPDYGKQARLSMVRFLRLAGRQDEGLAILQGMSADTHGDWSDEMVQVLFENRNMKELAALLESIRQGRIPCGHLLQEWLGNRQNDVDEEESDAQVA